MSKSDQEYWELLARWQELVAMIKRFTGEERALRESLFNGAFPEPTEGTQYYDLPDGRRLKGTYKLYRNVDQDAAAALPTRLRNTVMKTKFELKTAAYRELDEDTRREVDAVLTIKPGLPGLEVIEKKPEADEVPTP